MQSLNENPQENNSDTERKMRSFRKHVITRLARTNSIVLRSIIMTVRPKSFFKAFYAYASPAEPFSGVASLSFDCDHDKDITALPHVLEALSSLGIPASFACVGRLIERYPQAHQTILDHGHEILNHTYNHPYSHKYGVLQHFDKLTSQEQREEISRCHEACRTYLDFEPIGFRIPHFQVQYTDAIYRSLSLLKYAYSSSILANRTLSFGEPYSVGTILEFPVTTCALHPHASFDTFHAFRGRFTRHSEQDFLHTLEGMLEFGKDRGNYMNLYVDPQDFTATTDFLVSFLEMLKSSRTLKTYAQLTDELKL